MGASGLPVLKKWGIHTYLDSHDLISVEEKPLWYGGLLNLTHLWSTMRLEFVDGGLEAAQKEFDSFCERAEAFQLVSIYFTIPVSLLVLNFGTA